MKDYIGEIEKLSKVMDAQGINHVTYSEGTFSISLSKGGAWGNSQVFAVPRTAQTDAQSEFSAAAEMAETPADSSGAIEIKSPMVGVFFMAPAPDAEPFVRIGDTVKKGDVLCILEAMKLMNEIQAEADGKITDICVKNGDVVEFGQVLFKIAP